jgi:hypothetical protein
MATSKTGVNSPATLKPSASRLFTPIASSGFWDLNKENRAGGDAPPVARGGSFGRGGKVVLVEAKAKVII